VSLFPNRNSRRPAAVGALLAAFAFAMFAGSASAPARSTAAPANTAAPTISGQAQAGQTLTADPGTWSGTQPITFAYQWRRCNKNGAGCGNIGGATAKTYTVAAHDVGHTLRVAVTGTNSDGSSSATSSQTAVVTPAGTKAPVNTARPTISGTAREGDTLTASAGTWQNNPNDFNYFWRRCNDKGGGCQTIAGANKTTYTLVNADVGHTMRVLVTARNPAGATDAVSDPTAVVQAKSAPAPPGACVAIQTVALPQRLVVDRIQYTPSRIHSRSVPLQARFHVVTTQGSCVRGALVYAVGVPFDRLSKEPEVETGGDGWATITFHVLPTFQLRPGNLVVIFVRARKQGESVLAGVSTRRLVSVRVG
jgi:hypothetical protein